MFFLPRLAFCGAFLLLGSSICIAQPRPSTPTLENPLLAPKEDKPLVQVERVTVDDKPRLNIEVRNSSISKALGEIAQKGNFQLFVKEGVNGLLPGFSREGVPPEVALQEICAAVNLRCELKSDLWLVSPAGVEKADTDKPKTIGMSFSEVEVTTLLDMLSKQFDLPIALEGDVNGHIVFICLKGKTPRQALDIICQVTNLKTEETDDGTLIISQKKAK